MSVCRLEQFGVLAVQMSRIESTNMYQHVLKNCIYTRIMCMGKLKWVRQLNCCGHIVTWHWRHIRRPRVWMYVNRERNQLARVFKNCKIAGTAFCSASHLRLNFFVPESGMAVTYMHGVCFENIHFLLTITGGWQNMLHQQNGWTEL